MSQWTRSSHIPFPSTWTTFEGKKETNGSKRTYWIQDITDEHKDQVVKYMVEGFTADEPLCRYGGGGGGVSDATLSLWVESLNCNLGLVCLTKDENNKPTIAGFNCTTICTVNDENGMDKRISEIWKSFYYVKTQGDAFNKLNVTKYLDALGLYVVREYRGEGLGVELLKAREPLSRACGLTASVSIFSSIFSQKAAERAGFKNLYEIDYDELEKINPKFRYPGIEEHTKGIKVMYIEYK